MVFAGDVLIWLLVMMLTLAGVSLMLRFDRVAVTTIPSTGIMVSEIFFLKVVSGTSGNETEDISKIVGMHRIKKREFMVGNIYSVAIASGEDNEDSI